MHFPTKHVRTLGFGWVVTPTKMFLSPIIGGKIKLECHPIDPCALVVRPGQDWKTTTHSPRLSFQAASPVPQSSGEALVTN